jgi:hypothetical protein
LHDQRTVSKFWGEDRVKHRTKQLGYAPLSNFGNTATQKPFTIRIIHEVVLPTSILFIVVALLSSSTAGIIRLFKKHDLAFRDSMQSSQHDIHKA